MALGRRRGCSWNRTVRADESFRTLEPRGRCVRGDARLVDRWVVIPHRWVRRPHRAPMDQHERSPRSSTSCSFRSPADRGNGRVDSDRHVVPQRRLQKGWDAVVDARPRGRVHIGDRDRYRRNARIAAWAGRSRPVHVGLHRHHTGCRAGGSLGLVGHLRPDSEEPDLGGIARSPDHARRGIVAHWVGCIHLAGVEACVSRAGDVEHRRELRQDGSTCWSRRFTPATRAVIVTAGSQVRVGCGEDGEETDSGPGLGWRSQGPAGDQGRCLDRHQSHRPRRRRGCRDGRG